VPVAFPTTSLDQGAGAKVGRRAIGTTGIRLNEHREGGGPTVFVHACKLGLESIVSKRKPIKD
jgi:ATP-dependent DNA ligase